MKMYLHQFHDFRINSESWSTSGLRANGASRWNALALSLVWRWLSQNFWWLRTGKKEIFPFCLVNTLEENAMDRTPRSVTWAGNSNVAFTFLPVPSEASIPLPALSKTIHLSLLKIARYSEVSSLILMQSLTQYSVIWTQCRELPFKLLFSFMTILQIAYHKIRKPNLKALQDLINNLSHNYSFAMITLLP